MQSTPGYRIVIHLKNTYKNSLLDAINIHLIVFFYVSTFLITQVCIPLKIRTLSCGNSTVYLKRKRYYHPSVQTTLSLYAQTLIFTERHTDWHIAYILWNIFHTIYEYIHSNEYILKEWKARWAKINFLEILLIRWLHRLVYIIPSIMLLCYRQP